MHQVGTALLLADSINKANNFSYCYEFNRHEKTKKRNPKEIGFSSIRGGNIVGEHKIIFFGEITQKNIHCMNTYTMNTMYGKRSCE